MDSESAEKIIAESGHDFHLKVSDFLISLGWEAQISPHYNDFITGKDREIDIIATKRFNAFPRSNEDSHCVTLRLFIECKYIKNEIVVWFRNKDIMKATELAMNNHVFFGCDEYCLQNTGIIPNKTHHYIKDKEVIKVWDYDKKNKSDALQEGMNSCLNSLIFYTEHQSSGYSPTINIPVIAINSFNNIYKRINGEGSEKCEIINSNVQMEVDYSYVGRDDKPTTKYFLIDIVSMNYLQDFINVLEQNDVPLLLEQLRWKVKNNNW